MAEKSPPKKKPVRQQVKEAMEPVFHEIEERHELLVAPEQQMQARQSAEAVAVADGMTTESLVKAVGDLRGAVGKTLGDLVEKLEVQVTRYDQVKRAIAAKEKELAEVYDIQKQAGLLATLLETQQRQKDQFEKEMSAEREELRVEIDSTRADWEQERKQRDQETKERDLIEQKRRQRETDEWKYAFAREQQQARDQFVDEKAKSEKEITQHRAAIEKDLIEREAVVKAAESELLSLRQQAATFPSELESRIKNERERALAARDGESKSQLELLNAQYVGEKNVLVTKIASLEETIKKQADEIVRLSQQDEKSRERVQQISLQALQSAAGGNTLAALQQALTDPSRKPTVEK